jgi:aldehyde dehydrogenase (NAD+)
MSEISDKIQKLKDAFFSQGGLAPSLRKERLKQLKKVIAAKEALISKALLLDLGKSEFESYVSEIGFILDELSFIRKNLDDWMGPQKVTTPLPLLPGKSVIYSEPHGVVLVIAPWNYPFQLCLAPVIGAIAAGNRVVVKPSEVASQTAQIIQEILEDVFEEDEVTVIQGAVEETTQMLKERYDYIFFTGSTAVGKVIMKAAAENLTPVTLELGGKSPCIIDESADLVTAAKRIVWGKFLNAGQTCVAPDYILVHESLKDAFVEKFKSTLQDFFGSDIKQSPDYPRIINTRHFDRLLSLLNPAKVKVGGDHDREGRYIAPTLMDDVEWTDKVMEDEIFGPILPVLTFKNLNDIIPEILKRPRPLALYFFGEDEAAERKILERISFGGGCINDTVIHLANPHLPFGGTGHSGVGSYHGEKSFQTFSHQKSVFKQMNKVDIPLRYPPYKGKLNWIKFFVG